MMKNVQLSYMCGHVINVRAFVSVWSILKDTARGNLCPCCAVDYDANHSKDNELTDSDIEAMSAQR